MNINKNGAIKEIWNVQKILNPISTGGRRFPLKFCLPVDNFFGFGLIATKFGDFS